ncbi:glutathione S-transferase family protein [Parahaliea mediterranea]|uniref:Glutathione S-transferase family protein n=1 Tax=Parahaliea mediterranea TaxID=651086 RepID=A0A939DHJ1_9GAMM|nr:glutathione S-transferase family protein [Parahaliea mediterranea]MBN7797966.1 glutathione S-transferase family protein [Parahaliea mediterranea]
MITLHGFPFSNYHNIVKHALMAKGLDFEEHITYPGSPELMAVNPLGKVPAMTTEKGATLSESSVLLEYLEDAYPESPLYPADPEQRAGVRRLTKLAELYFDLPARRLLPAVFGNAEIPEATLAEVREGLERGVAGLTALARFDPYVAGDELTMADLYLRYALAIPKIIGPSKLDWDVVAAVPGLGEWDAMMAESEISRKIDADQQANTAEFMAYLQKRAG